MRNAQGLAELFDFEEFEDHFEVLSSHAPALRVAADLIALRAVRRARVAWAGDNVSCTRQLGIVK